MRYPEFKEAEFSTTDIPIHRQFFRFCTFVYNNVIWIVFSILYGVGIYYFFNLVFSGINDSFYLNALSVGASLVTFFSAVVSVLSLLNADCMKKFEDDLKLLENRYLNGKKFLVGNFFADILLVRLTDLVIILVVHVTNFIAMKMVQEV